jgi:hypothetical protein
VWFLSGTEHINKEKQMHAFEKSGLGKAPFNFIGCKGHEELLLEATMRKEATERKGGIAFDVNPGNVGASCQHCGTHIKDLHYFESADGNTFFVGFKCAEKAEEKYYKDLRGGGYCPEVLKLKVAKRKLASKRRKAREATKLQELAQLLANETFMVSLEAHPHPNQWRAQKGDTLRNYAQWMNENSGTAGKLKLLKVLKKL